MRACACVRACVRACVLACVCVCICVYAYVCLIVCGRTYTAFHLLTNVDKCFLLGGMDFHTLNAASCITM